MATKIPTSQRVVADINITPLVDVVLVLLIIAMVLMPMVYVNFDTKVPERAGGGSKQDVQVQAIVLQITDTGKISINKTDVPIEKLLSKLHEIYSQRVDKTLFIDAADRLKYEKFIQILDICQKPGGAQSLTIMLNGPMSKDK